MKKKIEKSKLEKEKKMKIGIKGIKKNNDFFEGFKSFKLENSKIFLKIMNFLIFKRLKKNKIIIEKNNIISYNTKTKIVSYRKKK